MAETVERQFALGDNAARQLANATKTVPQYSLISPRWSEVKQYCCRAAGLDYNVTCTG